MSRLRRARLAKYNVPALTRWANFWRTSGAGRHRLPTSCRSTNAQSVAPTPKLEERGAGRLRSARLSGRTRVTTVTTIKKTGPDCSGPVCVAGGSLRRPEIAPISACPDVCLSVVPLAASWPPALVRCAARSSALALVLRALQEPASAKEERAVWRPLRSGSHSCARAEE